MNGVHPPGIQEWGTTPADFLEGRIAMIWTTTGNLINIRRNATFDFGVAPYPGKTAPASVLGGGNLYIFSKATQAEKDAAFQFAKFLTSDALLADWGIQTGYVAPRDGAWETPALKKFVADLPAAEVARKQIASSVPEFSTYENGRTTKVLNDAIAAAPHRRQDAGEGAGRRAGGDRPHSQAVSQVRDATDDRRQRIGRTVMLKPSRNAIYGSLMLLPAAALLWIFTYQPIVTTIIDSFYSTPRGRRPARFIGLDNYHAMAADPVFWKSVTNNRSTR